MDLLPLLAAVFGGGTIVGLASLALYYRSINARTYAEAGKMGAEGTAVGSDAVQRRYDALFDDLEAEITRLRTSHDLCESRLDAAGKQIATLRMEAANATADVKLARAEIVTLQDHLDTLERKVNRRRTP